MSQRFRKMAGTAAVFVFVDHHGPSPVERDGLVWTAQELHYDDALPLLRQRPAMANALALEGLEEYDQPQHGDVRYVESLGSAFVYWLPVRGWIQYREV